MRRATEHRGTSFVEILQNCNIFNDGAFADLTEKDKKSETQLILKHGEPLIFGKNGDKGIRMNGHRLEVVPLGEGGADVKELLVHNKLITGFRYFGLNDELGVRESLTVTDQSSNLVPGTTINVLDQFDARNNFYGYDIGATASVYRGRWWLETTGRVGIGANDRSVEIFGVSTTTVPGGGESTVPGGLLAQPTNIGRYEDTSFAVLPEANINVGYQLTCHVRAYVGYTFMYLSNAVRAGDAIDPVVNSSQIGGGTLVGDARPVFTFDRDSNLFLQGINVGLDVRF